MSTRIAIITVNYNSPDDTRRCVKSFRIIDKTRYSLHFFVVNNGCDGASNEYSATPSKSMTVINSKINTGFAGGNNLALSLAVKKDFDRILLINNDAWVEDRSFFDTLLSSPYDLSSACILSSQSKKIKDFGGVIDWIFGRNIHAYKKQEIDYLSGACLFAHPLIFKRVNFFDEGYFLYYEDVDFCLRVKKSGYSLGMVTDTFIRHDLSTSTNRLGRKKLTILANSHLRFCLKHLNPAAFPFYLLFNLYLRFKSFFL